MPRSGDQIIIRNFDLMKSSKIIGSRDQKIIQPPILISWNFPPDHSPFLTVGQNVFGRFLFLMGAQIKFSNFISEINLNISIETEALSRSYEILYALTVHSINTKILLTRNLKFEAKLTILVSYFFFQKYFWKKTVSE